MLSALCVKHAWFDVNLTSVSKGEVAQFFFFFRRHKIFFICCDCITLVHKYETFASCIMCGTRQFSILVKLNSLTSVSKSEFTVDILHLL